MPSSVDDARDCDAVKDSAAHLEVFVLMIITVEVRASATTSDDDSAAASSDQAAVGLGARQSMRVACAILRVAAYHSSLAHHPSALAGVQPSSATCEQGFQL